jgi:hypothetical protein
MLILDILCMWTSDTLWNAPGSVAADAAAAAVVVGRVAMDPAAAIHDWRRSGLNLVVEIWVYLYLGR